MTRGVAPTPKSYRKSLGPYTNPQLRALAVARFEPFFETLQSCPLTCIREWTELNKDQYRRQLAEALKEKPRS